MFHVLALVIPFADAFLADMPDGFVKNRTLILGFVAALVLAFIAKWFLRSLDTRRVERHEEQREMTATTGNGPPTFNG